MKSSELPYQWFTVLLEAAKAVFEFIVDRDSLAGAAMTDWNLGGDTYAPVTTLTWKTDDDVWRNLHLAVVAPDDASYVVPGSKAVVDANAWLDAADAEGRSTRRAKIHEIGRLNDLAEGTVEERVPELQMLLWEAYGAVSQVDRQTLSSDQAEKVVQNVDPGPIRLEAWLGE